MNFGDIIMHGLKAFAPTVKKSTAVLGNDSSSTFFFGGSRDANWLEMYNENPRLAVVHKISQDNGSTSFTINGKNNRGKFIVTNHPLEQEINKHSVPQLFALWTAYRLMQGVVYLAYDLVGGVPTNLKLFTKYHLVDDVDEYTFKYGSGTITYPKNRVIVDLDLDLTSPYNKGRGKAEAIKDELETDEIVQQYIKNFYFNSARPDIIITNEPGEEMSEADVARIEAGWINKFQGYANAHKPVFLNWAAKVFSVETNHRDMELLDTRRFYRDTIIQHFGVPPEIMGIVENSNKATVIAAEHIYAKQVRMPTLHLMELIINTKLLPLYPNSEKMWLEFENIVPDDVELDISVLKEAREARAITVNEWRTKMGFPKITSSYGSMILGSEPMIDEVIEVDSQEVDVRAYKDYKDILNEDFVARASIAVGKELSNDTIILLKEEN